MTFPFGETVTVQRPGGRDRYGDVSPGTEFNVEGVGFAPRYSNETNSDNRNTVITGLQMYVPIGIELRPTDVVVRNGVKWRVQGLPGEWVSPLTGWKAGIEVALERVTG